MIGDDVVHELCPGSILFVAGAQIGLRVDGDPSPSKLLFQVERRAALSPIPAPDVDKHSISSVVEEVSNDQFFVVLGIELCTAGKDIGGGTGATGDPESDEQADACRPEHR